MRSSFAGLDIAFRALQVQQQGLDVVNHNIANANTPGYSRQVAEIAVTPPLAVLSSIPGRSVGQMGTGAEVASVRRSRSSFIDYQARHESQTLGRWEKSRDALQQVELVFNEPSDLGLNSLMTKFWQAWQDLTNSPQHPGARRALLEQADSLAVAINRKYSQLISIQHDLDAQLRVETGTINQLAGQIASLNTQIAAVELLGQRANDLRDQRDLMLDRVSSLARVSYYEDPQGGVNVFIGGRTLVFGSRAESLSLNADASGFASIVWSSDGAAASITDGELYGLQEARDVELPEFIGDLRALSQQLMTSVNSLHSGGYGLDNSAGQNFFEGTGPDNMAVNPLLKLNPEKIAAAGAPDSPGDNTVALAIAGLQRSLTMNSGTSDFGQFLASTVSRLGVDTQRADLMARNQQVLVDHLNRQQDSLSGVSLNEEAIRLIEFQRAYEAAARVITSIDEMLDRLINGTGRVGR